MSWKPVTIIQTAEGKNQCPVVDTNNEGFWRIYYSHRDENKYSHTSYIDVEAGKPEKLIQKSQTPVLSPGKAGEVDTSGAMATSILTMNDSLKYMYYIGWTQRKDVPYYNTTCLAVSEDGNTWNKVGPILSPCIHDSGYSGTFYPILNKSKTEYTALYLSCFEWIDGDPRYNLKRAISKDGVNWTKTLDVAIDITPEEGGVSQASILYNSMQGVYQLWYSVRDKYDFRTNPKHSYRIRYAESLDLINWTKVQDSIYDINPGLQNFTDFDEVMCAYPCVVKHEDTLFMFYNGNGFGNTGIGVLRWE